jgi:hypothetical protein
MALLFITVASSPLGADQAFDYFYLDPLVVYKGDTETTMKLELATTGQDIVQVRLETPSSAILYDDGSHGDRVAGDGIYTLDGIEHRTEYGMLGYGGTHIVTGRFKVVIEKNDGSEETAWIGCGVVGADQHFPAVRVGNRLSATNHAFFIVDPGGELLDTVDWPLGYVHCGKTQFGVFEELYSVYDDIFDFVIIMPAHPIFDPERSYGENVPYYVRAKNEIENIGMDIFDNTIAFHSDGRLMGMIYHSWGGGAILDHEIGHAWAADMGEVYGLTRCDQCYGNHWNPNSDIGGQMGAFLFHPDVQYGAGHLHDNGDGTWRIERVPDDNRIYSPLELYVMGLIPPEEVPPVHLLINPDITDAQRVTAERIETYTIEDLMAAEGGERVPSYESSPKQFNVAFVVVKNKAFTPAEYAYYSLVSRYFASTRPGEWALTTFYTATGGRARLNPLLPSQVRRGRQVATTNR